MMAPLRSTSASLSAAELGTRNKLTKELYFVTNPRLNSLPSTPTRQDYKIPLPKLIKLRPLVKPAGPESGRDSQQSE